MRFPILWCTRSALIHNTHCIPVIPQKPYAAVSRHTRLLRVISYYEKECYVKKLSSFRLVCCMLSASSPLDSYKYSIVLWRELHDSLVVYGLVFVISNIFLSSLLHKAHSAVIFFEYNIFDICIFPSFITVQAAICTWRYMCQIRSENSAIRFMISNLNRTH